MATLQAELAVRLSLLGSRNLSGSGVTLDDVRVTEADIARIPVGNVRVPRTEFAAVWAAAEDRTRPRDEGVSGWFTAGVAVTCRWLAGAVVEVVPGRRGLAASPVGKREVRAYEELIEAEFLAAERLADRRPDLVEHRPGWCEGIAATLRWAWRHDGPSPLPSAVSAVSTTA